MIPEIWTPEDQMRAHNEFQREVEVFVVEAGYSVVSSAYHDWMDREAAGMLRPRQDDTSIYLKHLSDLIAVPKDPRFNTIEIEVKTHWSPKGNDMLLDGIPALIHRRLGTLFGVMCLYVHKNFRNDQEIGFWAHEMPPVKVGFIPKRWHPRLRRHWMSVFEQEIPGLRIVEIDNHFVKGSKDPFLVVDESELEKLPHWKTVVPLASKAMEWF